MLKIIKGSRGREGGRKGMGGRGKGEGGRGTGLGIGGDRREAQRARRMNESMQLWGVGSRRGSTPTKSQRPEM